jgi:hypothetical protein
MRTLAAALVVSVALGATASPAGACGDKLLVIGRRVKRIPPAKHPATVLLYLRPDSVLPAAAREMKLESTLRQAGHHVVVVDQEEGLRGRLAAGRYDFVLTDLEDAASVAEAAGRAAGAPDVVPVVSDADDATFRSSRQRYPLVIEAGRSRSYLSALDSAMKERESR